MSTAREKLQLPGIQEEIDCIIDAARQIILGKDDVIRLALACLFARGHLLIEDLPGVGKTTLSHVLANILGLAFQRIQFTSDLLPADILGVSVYNRDTSSFTFHPGPIFNQIILADEINRATPRTQSARHRGGGNPGITTTVLCHRHPESLEPGGDISLARIPARPFHDAHQAGLSR
ncbi:MAG: AAA family ATPase [Gammaproteobacteria bacterium]